jgi:hypothetical protein
MAKYLTNTLQSYDRRGLPMDDIEGSGAKEVYSVTDYTSVDHAKIREFVDSLSLNYFDWYQLQNNTNLEKLALDLYGNPDYWDIFIVVNHRNPLFEFPYDYDTLTNMVENKIAEYVDNVYGGELSTESYNALYENYKNELVNDAEKFRIIKIVKPSKIYDFLQKGYEQGLFL